MPVSHSKSLSATNAGRILRTALSLVALAVLLASMLPLGTLAPLALGVPVAAAAGGVGVGCEVESTDAVYPAANSTIVTDRRQPWSDTASAAASPKPVEVTGNTIWFHQGQVTIAGLKSLLDSYAATLTVSDTVQPAYASSLLQQTDSNTWLLRGNLLMDRTAGLAVVPGSDINATPSVTTTLRIESTATTNPPLNIKNYGYVKFSKTSLLSWDTTKNAPDTDFTDGRAYEFAFEGGRTDFYNSEVSYLGFEDGEASGIAWRKCSNNTDNRTGATGDIIGSNIHNNYFGMYSYEAYGIWANNNRMHDNEYYGFDPHDYSRYFIFENNQVYNNGKHGIIFSRWCDYNIIRNNTVRDEFPKANHTNHVAHGIMLDRRSNFNQILNNTVQNNGDGIAIFQSTDNIIKGNTVTGNGVSTSGGSGIRINATPVQPENGVPDRTADQPALRNQIIGNTLSGNLNYGIYLYQRADNTVISGNTITNNGVRPDGTAPGAGIAIKTGGNTISNNTIQSNGHGISLIVDNGLDEPTGDGDSNTPTDASPTPVTGGLPTASQNTIQGNHIFGNQSRGINMKQYQGKTTITPDSNVIQSNEINANGDEGIFNEGGSKNLFQANYIHNNGAPVGGGGDEGVAIGSPGIYLKGAGSGNTITQNRITANGSYAIKLGGDINNKIASPVVTNVKKDAYVTGTALPGTKIEVFSDPLSNCGVPTCGDEAANYVGTTTADSAGNWTLVVNPTENNATYSATQTDSNGNTSALSGQVTAPTVTVGPGRKGENTIYVSGKGADVTLPQIQKVLQTNGQGGLLTSANDGTGKYVWTLNASLFISPTVTLHIAGGLNNNQSVDWLRLFSDPGPAPTPNPSDPEHPIYNANYFATIKAYNSTLDIRTTKITSWDRTNQKVDEKIDDGRAFVLAKYDSSMTIVNSEMSYLGYKDGEAYGVSWRDVDPTTDGKGNPYTGDKRLRVTGDAINSIFSYNYYGIYTFQASDMTFSGNKMFSNNQYGFDPHDFTHDVIVDGNESYNNGSHGFIISRGCSNFVFRNNSSHDNKHIAGVSKNDSSHGFMLDPGADPKKSGVPQAPSTNNLIENNVAYGNDGYAVRVFGSTNNTIRNNTFYNNRLGITLENGSTGNLIDGNTIKDNAGTSVTDSTGAVSVKGGYGVYAFGGSDNTVVQNNTITGNANTGVYLKTANNLVQGNTIANNKSDGIGTLLETSSELPDDPPSTDDEAVVNTVNTQSMVTFMNVSPTTPLNNVIDSNTVQNNAGSGMDLKSTTNVQVSNNTVTANAQDGVYVSNGSTGADISTNTVTTNQGYGIKINGADVQGNMVTQNSVTGNTSGAIAVTSGANSSVTMPSKMQATMASATGTTSAGSVTVTGVTTPGAVVEIFSDTNDQAAFYEGSAQADSTGAFTFTTNGAPRGTNLTSTATDGSNSTSSLSKTVKVPTGKYTVYLPIIVK